MKFINLMIALLLLFTGAMGKQQYDVVVYGATPSGITAAVAAARDGKSVVVVEPLPLVGGIMSGGLGFSDSNQMARESMGGLFIEFHRRVEEFYIQKNIKLPYKISDLDAKPWTYEPHVAQRVFEQMLKEAGVVVVLNENLHSVKMSVQVISSMRTISGKTFIGKVFIDASYEGDLLAAAKVSYSLGREGRTEFNESLAGAIYQKKAFTFVDSNVDKQLPLITGTRLTDAGKGDNRLMAYSFRLCLTTDPANRIAFTKPVDYNSAQYELFRQFYKVFPDKGLMFDTYALPGNKLDGNNSIAGQLSLALVGGSSEYPEAKPAKRKSIWQAHRSYTEGLLYFLSTDTAVPEKVRERMNKLGYAKDEFVDYGHFPPVLYVREGRRMQGAYFLTQDDILNNVKKPDVIGIASFPIDSHDCQRIRTEDGKFINEGTIFPVHIKGRKIGQPYQVPYRAIIPKASECKNLLVPVSLSSSHVAFSSLRVEPTWMVLGESAGIAASLAIESNVSVQDVDITKLQKRLTEKGQILAMPE